MAFLDIWDKITSNNSKRIYNKMNSNNDNFCVGDKELHERAAAYLYDECMDKCNMKEMNQVACLLMLMINGRVKCDKEKKKNMLLFLKKFVIFSRSFTDEQCKGMSYPINLLCLIYRNNDYLRELSLERPLIPLDTEFHYLKKIITDAHHRYL
uniref:Uncharacterized protein n=1 Tax=Panagrolaimus superbus TaxID=310955 RepID=A0A914Z1M6_9BILA